MAYDPPLILKCPFQPWGFIIASLNLAHPKIATITILVRVSFTLPDRDYDRNVIFIQSSHPPTHNRSTVPSS